MIKFILSTVGGVIILWLLWSFPIGIYQAIKITRMILKDNRPKRDGNGKYSADRFIRIWYSDENIPFALGSLEGFRLFQCFNIVHPEIFVDKELSRFKLIEIKLEMDHQVVRPIKNWRNKIVLFLTIKYLIWFIGDDISYYNNLKDLYQKSKNKN